MGKRKKRKNKPIPAASTDPAPGAPAAKPRGFPWDVVLKIGVIAAVIFWIYAPALDGGWLWDDDFLIQNNPAVVNPMALWGIWFEPGTLIDYYPLTVSLEWLEWQLWPGSTLAYHLTSVFLHLTSALLLWYLFRKLGLRLAWLGALLFAVHPALVESVAWMVELKNTLSLPPFLLALAFWIDYERNGRRWDYALALIFFITAMLCKTTMVMFPVLILLYAWWLRHRLRWRDLVRSAPFFGVSAAFTLLLLRYQHHGIGENLIPLDGFPSRLACAGLSLSFYFSKAVLPVGLLPIYPQWKVDPPELIQFLCWPVLAGAVGWLWTRRGPWSRAVLLGLGFFVLNLLPFIGFHDISFMRFGWVMDHFLYVPCLGLLGLVVAALDRADENLGGAARRVAQAGLTVVLGLFALGSHQYAEIFASPLALWSYTVQRNPAAWVAHNDLGNALIGRGRLAEAQAQFEEAVSLHDNFPEAYNDLGAVLAQRGHFAESRLALEKALQLDPDLVSAQVNLQKLAELEKAAAAVR
jgi:hypothetical protein